MLNTFECVFSESLESTQRFARCPSTRSPPTYAQTNLKKFGSSLFVLHMASNFSSLCA